VYAVADRTERARSFGAVADSYDRLRPAPAPAALDWLVPDNCGVAVDVAAGTGLFTRALARRVAKVVAVEPDPRMREVLGRRSPEVQVVDGTGEQIPLPDSSADALFVASAWHWLDPQRAVAEAARVLRDGGRFAVLWTIMDRDVEWVRMLDPPAGEPAGAGDAAEPGPRGDAALVPANGPFIDVARSSFGYQREMPLDDIVGMVATYSAVLAAADHDRDVILDRARRTLGSAFPGADVVAVPIRTWCWRADRAAR
jgi:SAM-dependent methyltransferase